MRASGRKEDRDNSSQGQEPAGSIIDSVEGKQPEETTDADDGARLKAENDQLRQQLQYMQLRLRFYMSKMDAIGHVLNNPEPKF